jgi:hypothetical protein
MEIKRVRKILLTWMAWEAGNTFIFVWLKYIFTSGYASPVALLHTYIYIAPTPLYLQLTKLDRTTWLPSQSSQHIHTPAPY